MARLKDIPFYWFAWAAVAIILALVTPIFQFLGYLGILATLSVALGLLFWYEKTLASKRWSAALQAFPRARAAHAKGDIESVWTNMDTVFHGFAKNRHYTAEECKFIALALKFSREAAPEALGPGVSQDLDIFEPHIQKAATGNGLKLSPKLRGESPRALRQARYVDYLAKGLALLSSDDGDKKMGVRLLALALHAPSEPADAEKSYPLNLEALCHLYEQCPWILNKDEIHPAGRFLIRGMIEPEKRMSARYLNALSHLSGQVLELLNQNPTGLPPKPVDFDSLSKLREQAVNEIVSGVEHSETTALLKKDGVHPGLAWAVTNLEADSYVPFIRKTMTRQPPAMECDLCHTSIKAEKRKFYSGTWRSENPAPLKVLNRFASFKNTDPTTLEGTYALCRACYKRVRPYTKWERAGLGVLAVFMTLGAALVGVGAWQNFMGNLTKETLGIVVASAGGVSLLLFILASRQTGTNYEGYPRDEDETFRFQGLSPIRQAK